MVEKHHEESDFGTIETQKQGGGVYKGYTADGGKVAVLLEGTHLAYLLKRGNISDKQALAGDYFFRDALIAGKVPFVKSSCDHEVRCNTNTDPFEMMIRASFNLEKALRLFSFDEYTLIHRVVIKGEAVGAQGTKWREARVNMQILCSALDSLVKFYGI